jgi:hypothetical protein
MTLTSTPSRGPCSKPSGSIAVLMQAIMLPPAMPSAPAAAACPPPPPARWGHRRITRCVPPQWFVAVKYTGPRENDGAAGGAARLLGEGPGHRARGAQRLGRADRRRSCSELLRAVWKLERFGTLEYPRRSARTRTFCGSHSLIRTEMARRRVAEKDDIILAKHSAFALHGHNDITF